MKFVKAPLYQKIIFLLIFHASLQSITMLIPIVNEKFKLCVIPPFARISYVVFFRSIFSQIMEKGNRTRITQLNGKPSQMYCLDKMCCWIDIDMYLRVFERIQCIVNDAAYIFIMHGKPWQWFDLLKWTFVFANRIYNVYCVRLRKEVQRENETQSKNLKNSNFMHEIHLEFMENNWNWN